MSPGAENMPLSDLVSWDPTVLQNEVSVLDRSLESIAKSRARLAETLDLLPDVWTGIAAEAVRDAISTERCYVDVLERDFLTLRRCYDIAFRNISLAYDTLMTTISKVENQGFSLDYSSPAGGPITVSGTTVVRSDSDVDASRMEEAHRAADAVAKAARVVLDYDAQYAEDIATVVGESEAGRPAAADTAALDTASREKHVDLDRYDVGVDLDLTATEFMVNGLGLLPGVGNGLLLNDISSAMKENRASFGDALIERAGAKLSGRVGKTLGSGLELAGFGTTGRAVAQFFGPQMLGGTIDSVLDASVGAAGRSFDERWGTQIFGPQTTEQLARKALRDQESGN